MKKHILSACLVLTAFAAANAQTILSADFESGMPSGWTQTTQSTDGGWLVGTGPALSSSAFPIPEHTNVLATNDDGCNCDKSVDYLYSPIMDLSAYTGENIRLTFDLFFGMLTYQGATESFEIQASDDGGSNWTTIHTNTGDANWQDGINLDLSSYAGETDFQLAFRFDDGNGWTYGAVLDNIVVAVPSAVDLKLTAASVPKYIGSGQTGAITGTVFNNGTTTASGYDVNWTDGTNTYTYTVSSSLAPGASANFTHGTPIDPSPGAATMITVEVEIANDGDLSNNSLEISTAEVAFVPHKVVVGEEATGTWCGWCPRGAVWMEYMEETYGEDWIGVAVHNADPMVVTAYDSWMGGMVGGYPSAVVDRKEVMDPSELEDGYTVAMDEFGVAEILVLPALDDNGNVEVNIQAHFAVAPVGTLRLAGVVFENGVTGTTAGYNQANYYAGGASGTLSGAGHDWHNSPNPVPASQMVYNEVGRELLGGIAGDANTVPASTTSNDYVHYQYTFTVDSEWDETQLHVAALLIENSTGYILNAGENALGTKTTAEGDDAVEVGGVTYVLYNNAWTDVSTLENINGTWYPLGEKEVVAKSLNVFPQPASSMLNFSGVEFPASVVIHDMRGAVVLQSVLTSAQMDVRTLETGVYMMSVTSNAKTTVEKITIVR